MASTAFPGGGKVAEPSDRKTGPDVTDGLPEFDRRSVAAPTFAKVADGRLRAAAAKSPLDSGDESAEARLSPTKDCKVFQIASRNLASSASGVRTVSCKFPSDAAATV